MIVLWADSLPGLQSAVAVSETNAKLVYVPTASAATCSASDADAPAGRVPTVQVPRWE